MSRAIVLFTRDLRVHDHPALAAAAEGGPVVPLFVLDDRLTRWSANRTAFLLDALKDLRAQFGRRGAPLVVRRGDPVGETLAVARETRADAIHRSRDVSPYAKRREAAGSGTTRRSSAGAEGRPACRWWTPRCASFNERAGCPTAPG